MWASTERTAPNTHPDLRAVGARCGVIKFSDPRNDVVKNAMLRSKAPGAQTVSGLRYELLEITLEAWSGEHPLTIVTDATHTL